MNAKDMFTEIKPVEESTILTYGKYRGFPVGVILERDPSYLLWLEETVLMFVLPDELWKKAATSIVQKLQENRQKKVETYFEVNKKISALSKNEKEEKRKKYYAKKKEKEEREGTTDNLRLSFNG